MQVTTEVVAVVSYQAHLQQVNLQRQVVVVVHTMDIHKSLQVLRKRVLLMKVEVQQILNIKVVQMKVVMIKMMVKTDMYLFLLLLVVQQLQQQ